MNDFTSTKRRRRSAATGCATPRSKPRRLLVEILETRTALTAGFGFGHRGDFGGDFDGGAHDDFRDRSQPTAAAMYFGMRAPEGRMLERGEGERGLSRHEMVPPAQPTQIAVRLEVRPVIIETVAPIATRPAPSPSDGLPTFRSLIPLEDAFAGRGGAAALPPALTASLPSPSPSTAGRTSVWEPDLADTARSVAADRIVASTSDFSGTFADTTDKASAGVLALPSQLNRLATTETPQAALVPQRGLNLSEQTSVLEAGDDDARLIELAPCRTTASRVSNVEASENAASFSTAAPIRREAQSLFSLLRQRRFEQQGRREDSSANDGQCDTEFGPIDSFDAEGGTIELLAINALHAAPARGDLLADRRAETAAASIRWDAVFSQARSFELASDPVASDEQRSADVELIAPVASPVVAPSVATPAVAAPTASTTSAAETSEVAAEPASIWWQLGGATFLFSVVHPLRAPQWNELRTAVRNRLRSVGKFLFGVR